MNATDETPVITLLTDFGLADHYVGRHERRDAGHLSRTRNWSIFRMRSRPYAITEAAFTLAQAWRCFPQRNGSLVVVDPGVGSARRPIFAEAAGHRFVAPDNGVLTMLFEAVPDHEVREITACAISASRSAGHFTAGTSSLRWRRTSRSVSRPSDIGTRIDDYVRLGFARPAQTGPASWTGAILKIDRFGNLITNFDSAAWQRLAASRSR